MGTVYIGAVGWPWHGRAATPNAVLNELEQAFSREAEDSRKLRQRAVFLRGSMVIAAALAIVFFVQTEAEVRVTGANQPITGAGSRA